MSYKSTNNGVYAYISTSAPTTCTDIGTWYRLEGIFTNEVLQGFSIPTTLLTYNSDRRLFQITILGTFTTDTAGVTLALGIYKNGILESNSEMITYLKTAGEYYNIGMCDVMSLSNTNTIEIRIMSDKAGAVVTAVKLTTSCMEF